MERSRARGAFVAAPSSEGSGRRPAGVWLRLARPAQVGGAPPESTANREDDDGDSS